MNAGLQIGTLLSVLLAMANCGTAGPKLNQATARPSSGRVVLSWLDELMRYLIVPAQWQQNPCKHVVKNLLDWQLLQSEVIKEKLNLVPYFGTQLDAPGRMAPSGRLQPIFFSSNQQPTSLLVV